jgi:nicotinic acetylcholine receptor
MENSSEWTLVTTKTGVYMVYAPTYALSYPMAYLELTLKRVPYYFVFNIIMPTVCLSTLSTLVFLIPAHAGEKMGLSVTLLMSYSVILLLLADNVPRSNSLPIMSE